jgi:2-(1,2-epoxy-1,2-dihydrophenyl)acetyl-CoA isomerase
MRKDFERAYLTAHDNVAVLTMNHPGVLNAASPTMVHGLYNALSEIEKPDSGFRAVVITGEGRGFCSGANLAEVAERRGPVASAGSELDSTYHPFLRKMRDLRMPILTAVNGAAAGIGMSIALMGDIICAARSAYFLQAFARIGLVPDGGSTWLLPRLIGFARARELSLLAEKLPAERALEWGLINRVFDDAALMEETLKLATRLANGPTVSLATVRKLYWTSAHNSFDAQLDCERQGQDAAGRSEDFREGLRAFHEKRQAAFKGR